MASNLRQTKRRIATTKNIKKITKAMEMVAASKMKKAQEQALQNRSYSRAIEDSLKQVAKFTNPNLHPLLQRKETGTNLLLLISTNKGLCGGLNSHLFRELHSWQKDKEKIEVIAAGKKAVNFVTKTSLPILAQYTELPEQIKPEDTLSISSLVIDKFLNEDVATVSVLYMDFINTISQKPRIMQILPIAASQEQELDQVPIIRKEYLFEPSPKEILNSLLPYYIENSIYQIFLEAKASEHSARMVAMKNASENAGELIDELQLVYNKSRQANITAELQEIATASLSIN